MTKSTATAQATGERSGSSETERADNIPSEITALVDGLTFGGAVRLRGELIAITPELDKQSRDRTGDSFLSLDADAQVKKYGRQMFEPGDHTAAIAEADEEARVAGIQAEKFQADRDGMQALRDGWAEEAAAMARSKSRWHSTSTGRPKT